MSVHNKGIKCNCCMQTTVLMCRSKCVGKYLMLFSTPLFYTVRLFAVGFDTQCVNLCKHPWHMMNPILLFSYFWFITSHLNDLSRPLSISFCIAPLGLNALEGEPIALDTTSYRTFNPTSQVRDSYRHDNASLNAHNVDFIDGGGSFGVGASAFSKPRELPRQRLPENFKGVSPLPASYSLKSDSSISLYRARMENRNVVLRVLKGARVVYDMIIMSEILNSRFTFLFFVLIQIQPVTRKISHSWALRPSFPS